MTCIECGRVWVRNYRVCPHCGADQDPDGGSDRTQYDDYEDPEEYH